MRSSALATSVAFFLAFSAPITAQSSGVQLEAGLGYARVFDGGGLSFAAAVEHPISARTSRIQHALGGSLWYAQTTIASDPSEADSRRIMGLGFRYQLGIGPCCRSPSVFLAVPVHLLRSSIPARIIAMTGNLGQHGIPELPAERPVQDQSGAVWGWGTGLELGVRLGLADQLSAQTSVQGLYQDIYESSGQNTAWNWHAGLTYYLGSR